MRIKRTIEQTVQNISATFPVLLLLGPRQVGKTTTLRALAEDDRTYVTLDDPGIRDLATREPALFLQRYSPPLIIDEIQNAPELLPFIKIYVDANRTKGSFWLTGTHMPVDKVGTGESLAGRIGIIYMSGLSSNEISGNCLPEFSTSPKILMQRLPKAKHLDLMPLFERIQRGSMPALYESEYINWESYYSSYVQTFIRRDIKNLMQISDEMTFYRFMCAVAARTGALLNYDALAKETEVVHIDREDGCITLRQDYLYF